MSSARGQANHKLYLARLVLAGWEQQRAGQAIPASTLAQAFAPGVRAHLLDAYGWLLLGLVGEEQPAAGIPHAVAELPAVAPGKATPAQLQEFIRLENAGWLAELQRQPTYSVASRGGSSLARTADDIPLPEDFQQWAQHLESSLVQIGDLLDEC
ncbi:hypothetical protein CWI75_10540 [Kineobactrum sediminis]|uniref:PasA protein n=1 Tax=Kineobactrum sediminis TaxID=1905677 RepID=A0A2N5Y1F1_9GAMM|nr:DUF6586 family protein [Kineobactrum sediminis]PLW82213.1 hypothetical protein CWI75_10540 [Kineobactrum sediminis]